MHSGVGMRLCFSNAREQNAAKRAVQQAATTEDLAERELQGRGRGSAAINSSSEFLNCRGLRLVNCSATG